MSTAMQTMLRSLGTLATFVAVSLGQADQTATAQSWPARPVTMVVPFTAGTPSDILARALAQYLTDTLGQPFRRRAALVQASKCHDRV